MICPICKKRPCYKKEKIIKNGFVVKYPNGEYFFIQTGQRKKIIEWWTCEVCAKKLPTKEYNLYLVNHQKEILSIDTLNFI